MTRRSGKRPRRRNILIVLLLFGAMGALVLLAHLRPPANLPTDDPPELTAERADKENNALYTLREARQMLPVAPPPLQLTDEDGWKYDYKPEENSMGGLLRLARPDDDALLLDYIKQCRPAMEFALTALDKPWYREDHPPNLVGSNFGESIRARRDLYHLSMLFLATAIVNSCSDDPTQDACRFFHDAVRLLNLINQDGWPFTFPIGPQVIQVIRKASPAHQKHIMEWAGKMRRDWTPPDRYVDACIRSVYGTSPSDVQIDHERKWSENVYLTFMLVREKTILRRHEDLVRQTSAMTYRELDAFASQHPEISQFQYRYFAPNFETFVWLNSSSIATLDTISIAVALETCKREKGRYPETLAALVPETIPELPPNPFDGQAYTYRPEGDDYVLYCRGGFRRRENWTSAQYLVFYAPPAPDGHAWKPPEAGKRR